MFHKGKFKKTGGSFKCPHFVDSVREGSGLKFLKRATNRAVRRILDIDEISNGCGYKRLIEVWDYNGDLRSVHHYCFHHSDDEEKYNAVTVNGRRYFPK